jgi:hypothetical protein
MVADIYLYSIINALFFLFLQPVYAYLTGKKEGNVIDALASLSGTSMVIVILMTPYMLWRGF